MALNHRKTVTYRLAQAARSVRARSGGHLSTLSLHPGQEAVLKTLAESDGLPMTQLAALLGVQPPTVTKMITRLGAQGYVERRASEDDARQAYVFLTKSGRKVIRAVDRAWNKVEKEALAGIGEKDRKKLRRLLRQIHHNLDLDAAAVDTGPDA